MNVYARFWFTSSWYHCQKRPYLVALWTACVTFSHWQLKDHVKRKENMTEHRGFVEDALETTDSNRRCLIKVKCVFWSGWVCFILQLSSIEGLFFGLPLPTLENDRVLLYLFFCFLQLASPCLPIAKGKKASKLEFSTYRAHQELSNPSVSVCMHLSYAMH